MGAVQQSFVIPVYNAEDSISDVVNGLMRAEGDGAPIQIVLVNDGSRDRSHEVCSTLSEKHPDVVTYIRLAKNFSEHNAVMAGLRRAEGAHVVVMDDDMQNHPDDAVRLCAEGRRGDYDIVYSTYPVKEHSFWRNIGSRFNGWVADILIDKPENLYLSSFKCMSRALVREIVKYEGPYPYIDGLALRCTRNIGCLEVHHYPRKMGRSGYTLRKLLQLWLNMSVNFSVIPLRTSTFIGFMLVATSALFSLWVLAETLAGQEVPSGWPFLMIVTMILSGTQLLLLGIIGEYLGRMFLTQNQTPQYVVRSASGKNTDDQVG